MTSLENVKENENEFEYDPKDYEQLNSLGKGSFGETYRVRNQNTGQTFVVKQLDKKNTDRDAFMEEVAILKQLLSLIHI